MNETLRHKIVEVPALLKMLAPLRATGKRLVQCHGCFDVVHPGHIRHLLDAAAQGDILLVSLTADALIHKSSGRPFLPQELRCENLAALAMVDFVTVDQASWAGPLLEQIRPEVYVKGLEYATNNDPRFLKEKEIVERYGGVVVYTSGEVVYSSTRLHQEPVYGQNLERERLRALLQRAGLTHAGLARRVAGFSAAHVAIVGDIVVDHYVECEQGPITAEAPILQVVPIQESFYVGGAGVVALHAAALGAQVDYLGFLDPHAGAGSHPILEILSAAGIQTRTIDADPPVRKTRYLVEGQKVFKVNQGRPAVVSSAAASEWLAHLQAVLATGPQGLIALDFGYGTLDRVRARRAVDLARQNQTRVFADVSSSRYASLRKFAGLQCDLVLPSEAEARAFLGEPEAGLPLLASQLFDEDMADAIALTLGPRGLVLFERDRCGTDADGVRRYLPEYLPSLATRAVDPLGAGDALTSVAVLTLLTGGDLLEAMVLGAAAAAVVLGQLGNEPLQRNALLAFLETLPLPAG